MDIDDEIVHEWAEEANRRNRAHEIEPEIPAEELFARVRRALAALSSARDRKVP